MVLVDELKVWGRWRFGRSCHLLPEDHSPYALAELHRFALSLGLRTAWFQPGRWPHYDLTASKRDLAIRQGAVPVDTKVYIRRLKSAPRSTRSTGSIPPRFTGKEEFSGTPSTFADSHL